MDNTVLLITYLALWIQAKRQVAWFLIDLTISLFIGHIYLKVLSVVYSIFSLFFCLCCWFFFFFLWPHLWHMKFPAGVQIRAVAADLHHSHRNTGSQLQLQPMLQLAATPDLWPTERGQRLNLYPYGDSVRYLTHWAKRCIPRKI